MLERDEPVGVRASRGEGAPSRLHRRTFQYVTIGCESVSGRGAVPGVRTRGRARLPDRHLLRALATAR
jgi:hypothetical protein